MYSIYVYLMFCTASAPVSRERAARSRSLCGAAYAPELFVCLEQFLFVQHLVTYYYYHY